MISNHESNNLIFKTVEKIDKDGNSSTVVQTRGKAKNTQADADRYYATQVLKQERSALMDVARINKQLAAGEITAAEASVMRANATAGLSNEVQLLAKNEKFGVQNVREYNKQQKAQIKTNNAVAKSTKGISASMKAMAFNVGAELAIMLAIQAAMWAWQKFDEKFTITSASKIEAMEKAVNDYNDAISESNENISTIKSLEDEFETLSKGVDSQGRNIGLTAEQYARYNEIVRQMVDMSPTIVQGYTAEGNAIVNRNEAIEAGIKAQEDYAKAAANAYTTNVSGDTIIEGVQENVKDARKNLIESVDAAETYFGGGAGSNHSKELGILFGSSFDLASASVSEMSRYAKQRDYCLKTLIETDKYEKEEIKNIKATSDAFAQGVAEMEAQYQPIYEWLSTAMNTALEDGALSVTEKLPESMRSAYETGLKYISMQDLNAVEMRQAGSLLATELEDFYSGKTKSGEKYLEIQEKITKEQEKVRDNLDGIDDKQDFEKYEKNVEKYLDQVDEIVDDLRAEGGVVNEALADAIEAEYLDAINFTDYILDLTNALNPLIDKINDAANAKSEFDTKMENVVDFDDSIDSFKEVYDEIMDGENNTGIGSIAFWTGAEQILGRDTVLELGDFSSVKAELQEINAILAGGESGTDAFFNRLKQCSSALNEVSDGAVKVNEKTGEISFDFDPELWAEYADALNMSEEMLTAAVNNSRQFADIDLSDIKQVSAAVAELETTVEGADGAMYNSFDTFYQYAQNAGLVPDEISAKVKELESSGIHLLDFNIDFNSDDASSKIEKLMTQLNGLNSAIAQDSDGNGIYEVTAENAAVALFKMGDSADVVTEKIKILQKAAEKGEIELGFKSDLGDKGLDEYIQDLYTQYNGTIAEDEEADPFVSLSNSAEEFTTAVNNLCIALGYIPDGVMIDFKSNIDDVNTQLDQYKLNADLYTKKEREEVSSAISDKIAELKLEQEKLEEIINDKNSNLTDTERELLKDQIDDYDSQISDLETRLNKINSKFNKSGDTKGSKGKGASTKETKNGSKLPYNFGVEVPTETNVKIQVEADTKEAQKKLGLTEDQIKVLSSSTAYPTIGVTDYATGPLTRLQRLVDSLKTVGNIVVSAALSIPGFAKGTPSSPLYRQHSSFPSMAKGGRLGPRGNGGLTLTGELGTELVWLPSESRSFLVGQYGPEMVNLPGDAVVYPADETRKILGDTISPGRLRFGTGSMARGNMQFGSHSVRGSRKPGSGGGSGGGSGSGKGSSGSSSKSDEFKEVFDWIEIAIDRIERAIDRLDLKASSVFKSWTVRNSALKDQISEVRKEIDLQQAGYNRYIQQANSVGLDESWAKLVREGKVDISTIKDEALAEKIKEYQEWYEKALDCQDAIDELREKEAELYQQRFEHAQTEYEGYLGVIEHEKNMIEEFIAQTEAKGYIVSAEYYKGLMSTEQDNINTLIEQRSAMQAALNEGIASGSFIDPKTGEYTEAYYDMVSDIDDVTLAIEEANTAMIEYGNSVREAEWAVFDLKQSRISRITDESDFLIDLMSNDKLYEDNGQLTNEGLATMALHAQNYNTYMEQGIALAEEKLKLQEELAKDPNNQTLIDRLDEITDQEWEMKLAAEDACDSIRDMVEEGINLELESLQELIDKYSEALDSRKDLYDYQKKIKDQVAEISSLEKQQKAYEGDTSEESMARIQQIKVQLEEARENLEESEYDKYISDQKELMDELYDEYEAVLNQRLDNVEVLMQDMIDNINSNSGKIADTLAAISKAVGYDISEEIDSIWGINPEESSTVDTAEAYRDIMLQLESLGVSLPPTLGSDPIPLESIDDPVILELIKAFEELRKEQGDLAEVYESATKDVVAKYEDGQAGDTAVKDVINSIETGIEEGIKDLNIEAVDKVNTASTSSVASPDNSSGSSSTSTPSQTQNTNNTSTTSTSNSWGSWFVSKKDSYPKNKLRKETSIVDRLKYFNFDSSFARRKTYFSKMGGSGTYTGSAGQNTWMINQMKAHGYKKGVFKVPDDEWAWTQEGRRTEAIIRPSDGAILTPLAKKDSVLNAEATRTLFNFANDPSNFFQEQLGPIDDIGKYMSSPQIGTNSFDNDFNITFDLPGVSNYEEFKTALQHDKKFESMIRAMTVDKMFGGSSLKKYKY